MHSWPADLTCTALSQASPWVPESALASTFA